MIFKIVGSIFIDLICNATIDFDCITRVDAIDKIADNKRRVDGKLEHHLEYLTQI
jgi:hypothetical protein